LIGRREEKARHYHAIEVRTIFTACHLDQLKIATRDSTLALLADQCCEGQPGKNGFPCKLIPLKTLGDINLVEPLYAMGVQGVFTQRA